MGKWFESAGPDPEGRKCDVDENEIEIVRSGNRVTPIGWVYGEYLDCNKEGGSGFERVFSFLKGWIVYDCQPIQQFPQAKIKDKDPVVNTSVLLVYDENRERFGGMEVQHQLASGAIHKRSERYRDFKASVAGSEDITSYKWTGILATNRSISMKGELRVVADLPNETRYTEQLTANGKLDWAGIWSCREHSP
jgi:hypothetical protein